MATNLLPISSDGGFVTAGNITTASYASPAPTISGFSSVSADNFRLMSGNIIGGIATVVDDGINSIALALGAQMDVYGFPFSQITRGQLTISGVTTPSEVNGTWYYQSVNTNTYQIYTDNTYATLVDATSWSAYTGGGNVAITKQVPAANIVINTNGYFSEFDNTGNLTLPGNIKSLQSAGLNVGSTHDVRIIADQTDNDRTWLFSGVDGTLTFPRDALANTDPYLSIEGGENPTISSTDVSLAGPANLAIQSNYLIMSGYTGAKVVVYADTGEILTDANMVLTTNLANTGNASSWVFDTTGNLTVPSVSGGYIKTAANASIGIVAMDDGTNNPAQLLSMNFGNGNATSIVSAYSTNVAIQTNAAGTINTWSFDSAGNLTLPANTFSINYANGTQVSLSASSSNISNGNSNVTIATSAGNVVTNVNGSTILTTYSGGIKVGGSGILQSPGGASAMTLNNNGANIPTANITNTLNVTGAGGGNITNNLVVGGTVTSTGKIGYAVGGAVTQTSTGQGVTLNQLTGLVTLATRTYNAGDLEAFSINCNKVSANDFILVQMVDSVNAPSYNVVAYPNFILANTISVLVKTLETVGTDTPLMKFMIVKAPIA